MRAHAAGFSLVELMISITLSLMVVAALATIFSDTSRARAELQRSSQQVDNGRYAIELLGEELQVAGFYGELDTRGLTVPGVLPDLCSTDPAVWNAAIPLHLQGVEPEGTMPTCIPANIAKGSPVIGVRRAQTCVAGVGTCDAVVANEPYLQVALCAKDLSTHALGPSGSTTFDLRLKNCTTTAGVRRYIQRIYYVSEDNGAGAAIPTLKRLEMNGASYTEVALVEGIEYLHVEYGIDTDGDGSPDAYSADPTTYTFAGCTTCSDVQNWSNVVTVKVSVLTRALDPTPGYVNEKTYDLGLDKSGNVVRIGPVKDGFRRQVFSAAVRVVNPSGRRETP